MEFSRQEHWSRLPFPTLEDLPDSGIKHTSCVSCTGRQIPSHCILNLKYNPLLISLSYHPSPVLGRHLHNLQLHTYYLTYLFNASPTPSVGSSVRAMTMCISFATNSAASIVTDPHKKDAQFKLSKFIVQTFQRILRSALF